MATAFNSRLPQECFRPDGLRKLKCTILASEWGSSKGGLSTINRELAIHLAELTRVEITFFLPQCGEEDKKQANGHRVSIVEAIPHVGFDKLDWLSFPPEELEIDVVVGHGVILGRYAQVIRTCKKCKWVQVVHTDPEELGMYKIYPNPISKGEEKHNTEVKLCEMADLVLGVGPKLSEAFRVYLRGFQGVLDFTPGVFNEFVSLKQSAHEGKHCRVLVFGRGDDEDFELKGFDIAGKAVAELPDTHLVFVGAPDGKHEEIAEKITECGVATRCLKVKGFLQSREKLKRLFQQVDLVLMPSRTEGFGLTGLEALSAGLPVLVSKNSGFGEALWKLPFGSSFVIDSEDPKEWATAIKNVQDKGRRGRLQEAETLRTLYMETYCWKRQCQGLLNKMINMVDDATTVNPEQTKCQLEDTKVEESHNIQDTLEEPRQAMDLSRTNAQSCGVRLRLRTDCEYVSKPGSESDNAAQDVLVSIAKQYLQTVTPSSEEEFNGFLSYLQEVRKVLLVGAQMGSLIITVECSSLQILDELWEDYCTGHLNDMAQEFLVTDDILKEFGLLEVKLAISILEEEYKDCRQYFLHLPGAGCSVKQANKDANVGTMGRIAMQQGDYQEALRLLSMDLNQISPRSTQLTRLLADRAECFWKLGHAREAVQDAMDAIRAGLPSDDQHSEGEAEIWKERGNRLSKEPNSVDLAIACYSLALNYTPPIDRDLKATILSNRSLMYIKTGSYDDALRDAHQCVQITPSWAKGQYRVGVCLSALKKYSEALEAFSKSLKLLLNDSSSTEQDQVDTLNKLLSVALKHPDGTTAITTHVPDQPLIKLLSDVIRMKDFKKLKILYLGGGGPLSHPVGGAGVAANINARIVPLGEVIRYFGPKDTLISVLLDQGASANVIEGSNVIPLAEAMSKDDLPLVEKLVYKGANCCVAGSDGEPLIHNALRRGLISGDFRFLEAMLNPEAKNVQNNQGDTLYHLVCAGRCTRNKCNAIKILQKANVNPDLPNMYDKYPLDMVNKRDSRWKMITDAMKKYTSNSSAFPPAEMKPGNAFSEEQGQGKMIAATEGESWSIAGGCSFTEEETPLPTRVTQIVKIDANQEQIQIRASITALIDALSPLLSFVSEGKVEDQDVDDTLEDSFVKRDFAERNKSQLKDEIIPANSAGGRSRTAASEHKAAVDNSGAEIECPFEDLPWEVDCTDQVWKMLRSKRFDNNMRKLIIDKIAMLASGRWNKTLCTRLKGVCEKDGIKLHKSKLTEGLHILWEKAIAFSSRLSDNLENLLLDETSKGRIYSEIIRVWDIVLDHDKLPHSVEHIVKLHKRGRNCLIKKQLQVLSVESRDESVTSSECLPNMFVERADLNLFTKPLLKKGISKKRHSDEDFSQIFFLPASSSELESHILKFYSFNTPLVRTVLESDTSRKVDFPFKMTELEHAIVNLHSLQTPVILTGGSGTGKTTCCLYRLWDNFKNYWEKAASAGPLFPKYPRPLGHVECSSEDDFLQKSSRQLLGGQERNTLGTKYLEGEDCTHSCIASSTQFEEPQVSKRETQCSSIDSNGYGMYEHLHQVFITKTAVLCSETEKKFRGLCRACPVAKERLQFEDQPTPTRIQAVAETEWPLFVNSNDWLLILDASLPGKPFFKRAEDGSLEKNIEGWGEEDNHLRFISAAELDEESDEEDNEEIAETEGGNEGPKERGKRPKDPRREITYEVFQHEIWPKMKKSLKEKIDYHPALIWTEIRSFLKGSVQALMTENGFLSLAEYECLGRKRAPNFDADRKVVYELFLHYQRERLRNGMYDTADLVFNFHRRLQSNTTPKWSIHQFYVDETQDFTQAELSLLISCCRFPNRMFFTGDTMQSVMRGTAFRFSDLKTLFHIVNVMALKEGQRNFIRVPKKVYQLTLNFRSHSGILRLASSIADLLFHYFPDSIDRLQKDQGMFEGPKPVLLESCTPTDLALILQGNQRQTSPIEFGAHQAVLVVSNNAREAMPDELKQGLVMTIYEAKGLEFDDVLIYNFFKDSQARKEWRIVSSFVQQQKGANVSGSTALEEVTLESAGVQHSRPLEFDPSKHKILNSEFKYLYTAITRARMNLWFFDEDEEARAPMYQYFRRLRLADIVTLADQRQETGQLAGMFAVKSTPEEWRKRGIRFYKKSLWVPAIQCFTFAGDKLMLQKSQAQQQAAEAIKFRHTNRQLMRKEFLRAGESFLQCKMYDEAAICLNNAREWILLARLYEKTGKYQDAARLFKKIGLLQEASRCYESQNNFRDAIETLCSAGYIDEALSAIERFNILSSGGDLEERQGIIPPRTTRNVERLRYQLADKHFKEGDMKKMMEVIEHLPSTTDRVTFLKRRGCIKEAARVMGKEGKRDEAAHLLMNEGMFEEAIKYSGDPKFTADCLVSQARTTDVTEDTFLILQMALETYQQCEDLRGQAEALLLLGRLSNEVETILEAGLLFNKCKNVCGEVESVVELLNTTRCSPPENFSQSLAVTALERLLRLVTLLFKPNVQLSVAEGNEVEKCEKHFGLFPTDINRVKVYYCRNGGRFSRVDPEFVKSSASESEAMIDTSEAHLKIGRFLMSSSVSLVSMIRRMLENTFVRSTVCKEVAAGIVCDNSSCNYHHEDSEELFSKRFQALFNFIYLESVVEQTILEMTASKNGIDVSPLIDKAFREFHACQLLYSFLFPSSGCRRYHLKWSQVRIIRMTKAVKRRILHFAYFLWAEMSCEKRHSDIDNFLKVSSLLQLIGSSSVMMKKIYEEENEFQRQTRNSQKTTIEQLAKNGMVVSDDTGRYESCLKFWEDGKKKLYVDGDVKNAAHLIVGRFLALIAKRSGMIWPSIASTLMILEHQLTACLALYTRLCTDHPFPICLPGSYLAMIRFWDNFRPNVDNGSFTLYEAVEHNASQERNKLRLLEAISSILDYMVRLTCGEVSPLFDVLGDTLSSNDTPTYIASGEYERSMVLFLTMLCNCGKGISSSVEGIMLRKLLHIKPNYGLPNRIKNLLIEVQEVKGYNDVGAVLNRFLQSRGEVLCDLRWSNGGLWYDRQANPNDYNESFFTATSMMREEDEESKDKENARWEVAARKIQSWYRGIKRAKFFQASKLGALKSIEENTKISRNATEEHFFRFKVDSSACGICGTNFRASTDVYHEDYEVKEFETVKAHKKSRAHSQKEEEFQQYKKIYLTEIRPCLMKEQELQKKIEEISSYCDNRWAENVALDLERLETALLTLKGEVQTIESSLDWANTCLLTRAVQGLASSLEGIFELLEQARKRDFEDDKTENEENEQNKEEEEDPIIELPQHVPERRGKHKRKKEMR